MKKFPSRLLGTALPILLGFLAAAVPGGAADQTISGNLTVTGTIGSAGAIDSDSNTFSFGTQGTSFGSALLYQNADADTLIFSTNRTPASWLWRHNTNVAAMRLSTLHELFLYQANGTTVGISLLPATNALKLGTLATLTGDSTGLLATSGPLRLGTLATLTGNTSGVITTSGALNVTGAFTSTGALGGTDAALSGSLRIYNTTDQVTNFERVEALWSSNVGTVRTTAGGTGSVRALRIASLNASGADARFTIARVSGSPFGVFTLSSTSTMNGAWWQFGDSTGTSSATSGSTAIVAITPTYNQASGTATNTDLLVNRTETAIGSGTQRLLDLQVGGASKFSVDRLGGALAAGPLTVTNATASISATTGAVVAAGGLGVGGNGNFGGAVVSSGSASSSFAGSVGVGLAAPTAKLEVVDTATSNGVVSRLTRNAKALEFYTGSMVDLQIGTPGNHSLGFYTNNNNPLLTLTAGQNVGIGTTTPDGRLALRGEELEVSLGRSLVDTSGYARLGLTSDYTQYVSSNARWIAGAWNFVNPSAYSGQATRWLNSTGVFQFDTASGGTNPITWNTRLFVANNGNVGIGTITPSHKLAVKGTIRANEVIVDTGWADYVFDESYRLAPLAEVEAHIKTAKHLPGIPSAAEVAEHGVSMGDMQAKLLSKVEELTLHLIAQEKEISALRQQVAELKSDRLP